MIVLHSLQAASKPSVLRAYGLGFTGSASRGIPVAPIRSANWLAAGSPQAFGPRNDRRGRVYWGCIWVLVKIMVPCWDTRNIRCRIIIGIQKGTTILTTTHMDNAKGNGKY